MCTSCTPQLANAPCSHALLQDAAFPEVTPEEIAAIVAGFNDTSQLAMVRACWWGAATRARPCPRSLQCLGVTLCVGAAAAPSFAGGLYQARCLTAGRHAS